MTARLIIGDGRDVLRTLPDDSVDMVMTSPPFLALRSYLPSDHPDKAKEIGSEPTPGEFIDALLDVTEELARVLAPHGSICVELGDTFSGSGGAGGDYNADGMRDGQPEFTGSARTAKKNPRRDKAEDRALGIIGTTSGDRAKANPGEWPLAKSLALIPESYRWALAYGRNPFTGRETDPWRVRNVVRWHRPNPPVGALGDKFRPSTSDLVIACKSRTRYFDLDSVRTEHKSDPNGYTGNGYTKGNPSGAGESNVMVGNPNGAPPLDTWIIPTASYKGSHYAVFPAELCTKPILSMCPRRVCTVCGEPSRRTFTENPDYPGRAGGPTNNNNEQGASLKGFKHSAYSPTKWNPDGWTDCGHDSWRNGVVLDPFAGSGTTLSVATGNGRDAIGIDLDSRNVDLCRERVGMFLEVVEPTKVAA